VAPDLVIEILSPSNSEQEMDKKKGSISPRGAWVLDLRPGRQGPLLRPASGSGPERL